MTERWIVSGIKVGSGDASLFRSFSECSMTEALVDVGAAWRHSTVRGK